MDRKRKMSLILSPTEIEKIIPKDFPRSQELAAFFDKNSNLVPHSVDAPDAELSPRLRYMRWQICTELADNIVTNIVELDVEYQCRDPVPFLNDYLVKLLASGWTSSGEARWVIDRVALSMNWLPLSIALSRDVN